MSHVRDDEAKCMAFEVVQATRAANEILGEWVGTSRVRMGRVGVLDGVTARKDSLRAKRGAEFLAKLAVDVEGSARGYGGGKLLVGDEEEKQRIARGESRDSRRGKYELRE